MCASARQIWPLTGPSYFIGEGLESMHQSLPCHVIEIKTLVYQNLLIPKTEKLISEHVFAGAVNVP